MPTSAAARVLETSRACVDALLETGDPGLGVAELCAQVGVPARTFHRYFPTKAQMIRPALTDATERFDRAIVDGTGSLRDRATDAFVTEIVEDGRVVPLVGLARTRQDLWATYLEAVIHGEDHLDTMLGQRLPDIDPARIRAVAVGVVSSSRLATDRGTEGEDPVSWFTRYIDAFAQGWPGLPSPTPHTPSRKGHTS
jgi:AcrR family transcriptional regulator